MQHNQFTTDVTKMDMDSDFFGSIEERKALTIPGTNEFSSSKKAKKNQKSTLVEFTRKNSFESSASTMVSPYDSIKKLSSTSSSESDDVQVKESSKIKSFLSRFRKT